MGNPKHVTVEVQCAEAVNNEKRKIPHCLYGLIHFVRLPDTFLQFWYSIFQRIGFEPVLEGYNAQGITHYTIQPALLTY